MVKFHLSHYIIVRYYYVRIVKKKKLNKQKNTLFVRWILIEFHRGKGTKNHYRHTSNTHGANKNLRINYFSLFNFFFLLLVFFFLPQRLWNVSGYRIFDTTAVCVGLMIVCVVPSDFIPGKRALNIPASPLSLSTFTGP